MGQLTIAGTVDLSSDVSASCLRLADTGVKLVDLSFDSLEQFTGGRACNLLVRAANQASANGSRIACISLARMPIESAVSDNASAAEALATLDELVRAGGDVGAGVFCIPPPAVASSSAAVETVGYREALNCIHRVLEELSPTAERTGLFLGVRAPHSGCLLSPVEVCELIDAVASPCVGISLDVVQLAEIGRVEDWLTVLGNHVVSVRSSSRMLTGIQAAVEEHLSDRCIIVIDESG